MIKRFLFAATMLLFANILLAYDFSAVSNGTTFYYHISSNTAPYTVSVVWPNDTATTVEHIYDGYTKPSGAITIPSTVTHNGITYNVVRIGTAFANCSGLTSVTIPNTVTSIGASAFYGCSGLTSITIPNSVIRIDAYAFKLCTGLTSITIPNSVDSLGENVFTYDSSLTTVYFNADSCRFMGKYDSYNNMIYPVFYGSPISTLIIGNNVKRIPDYAFSFCSNLTSVSIPNSVTNIGKYAFYNCTGLTSVTIPNSVRKIGEFAFFSCRSMTTLTIGKSVDTIETGAFGCDSNLTTVYFNADSCKLMNFYDNNSNLNVVFGACPNFRTLVIGNNVKIIPVLAFSFCTSLTSVTIGDSITSIGGYAFYECTNLDSITIPRTTKFIGLGAFARCTGLRTMNYNADSCILECYHYDRIVFTPFFYSDDYDEYSCNLTTLNIGDNVKYISDSAFYRCSKLTRTNYTGTIAQWCNIDFGNEYSNPVIYSHNLYINNQPVTNLVIPNTVNTIKSWFRGDTCITSLTIPNSVTSIGDYAFNNCTGLTSITFRRSNTTIGNNNFNGLPIGLPIHIPCGSSAWYRSNLQNFYNFIEELQYSYSVTSQDTTKGTVATITAPTCNSTSWTIRATANNGYTFNHWSDGDTNTQRTLTVNMDTTIVAHFVSVQPWYTFSVVSEDTLKGTVQIITQPSQANPQATFVALPNTGYTFSRWSDGNTQNPRTLAVTQDTALVAYFTANTPQWYSFSVVSEDTLKGSVQIITQPSQANPQATFVALPNPGYTFSRWSDGNTQNPRTLTVTQDTALVAYFTANTPQWYRFSVVSEDTLKGTVQIVTQPSQANPQATFVALPNTGYTFSRWSDGNTQNPRTLTVTQDTALVAYFTANTPQWYNFNVVSEDVNKGTVQVLAQPSQSNPQATFVALPNTGYTFSRWSDGNTQNPRSITVTQDTILIAFFTSNQGIAEAENASITLYPNPASETVTITGVGNEANILVINAMGKVVRRYENVGGTLTFSVGDLPKGIYFVRVGNVVRKLVVE